MSGTDNGIPFVERGPAYLSPYDAQVFNEIGITPLSVLRTTFATDYAALLADTKRIEADIESDLRRAMLNRMELGGRATRLKEMKGYGGKGDVAKAMGRHEDTISRWQNLYKWGPWGWHLILAEAAAAAARGEEYTFSTERIIKVGQEEAIRRGAVDAAKPKYTGTGQALMVDPKRHPAERVGLTDLPTSFVNIKRKGSHHWALDTSIKLPTGVQVWTEMNGAAKGYFSYEFPDPVGKRYFQDTRVLLARISKDDVVLDLGITNMEDWRSAAEFHARGPKDVKVFDIDPEAGKLSRDWLVKSNEYLEKGDTVETPMTGILADLTLVQDEPKSKHIFKLFDKEYHGRALIVRFAPDSRWLEELSNDTTAGDLLQHVSWLTLDAYNKIAKVDPVEDPNLGFETLDEAKAMDYFRCDMAQILAYAVREWGTGDGRAHLRQHNLMREIANPDDKDNPVTLIYDIAKIRSIVTKWRNLDDGIARKAAEEKAAAEAAVATAEADGFQEGMPEDYDDKTAGEVLAALNLTRDADLSEVNRELEARGLFRQIGDKSYYRKDMVDALLHPHPPATADIEAGEDTGEPLLQGFIGDFSPHHFAGAELNMVKLNRASAQLPDTISDYQVYRAMWENGIYNFSDVENERANALRNVFGLPPLLDDATEPLEPVTPKYVSTADPTNMPQYGGPSKQSWGIGAKPETAEPVEPVTLPWRSMDDLPLVGAILTDPVEPVAAAPETADTTSKQAWTPAPRAWNGVMVSTGTEIDAAKANEDATWAALEAGLKSGTAAPPVTEPVAPVEPVEATDEPEDDEPETFDEEIIEEPVAATPEPVKQPKRAVTVKSAEKGLIQKKTDLRTALSEINLVIARRFHEEAQIPNTVTLLAVSRVLEDGDLYHMAPEDRIPTLRAALGLPPLETAPTLDAGQPVEGTDDEAPQYDSLPYGERELADRKLRDQIVHLIGQADREALGTLSRVLGPNKLLLGGSADQQRDRVKQLADTLDRVLSILRQIEPLVTEAFDHLDVAKAERTPSIDEIVAFYATMRDGERRILWQRPDGAPKIDVTAYVVRTATSGDITLPVTPLTGDQPSIH